MKYRVTNTLALELYYCYRYTYKNSYLIDSVDVNREHNGNSMVFLIDCNFFFSRLTPRINNSKKANIINAVFLLKNDYFSPPNVCGFFYYNSHTIAGTYIYYIIAVCEKRLG